MERRRCEARLGRALRFADRKAAMPRLHWGLLLSCCACHQHCANTLTMPQIMGSAECS